MNTYLTSFNRSTCVKTYLGVSVASFLGYSICTMKSSDNLSWTKCTTILLSSLLKSLLWPVSVPYYGYKCISANSSGSRCINQNKKCGTGDSDNTDNDLDSGSGSGSDSDSGSDSGSDNDSNHSS